MDNNSGIIPKGHRILVLPEAVEEVSAGGIIMATATQQQREQMGQTDGVVIAIGATAFSDLGEPWCKVGDRVIFAKYAGLMRKGKDEKEYRIINDLDVVGLLS